MVSYDELMLGDPVLDAAPACPDAHRRRRVVIARGAALVDTAASEGEALGLARKSRLMEILSGKTLMSSSAARTAHPTPVPSTTAPDHSKLLNAAEKRLVAEWIDTGGKYYNDPFDAAAACACCPRWTRPRSRRRCSRSSPRPAARLPPGDRQQHLAVPAGTSFRNNRFVLTGDPEGDYNVTLTMISDACTRRRTTCSASPRPCRIRSAQSARRRRCCRWAARTTTRSPTGSREAA
jgi:hypothetical protein